jgi:hypothetical protein
VESVLKTVTGNSSGDMGKLTELISEARFPRRHSS